MARPVKVYYHRAGKKAKMLAASNARELAALLRLGWSLNPNA
jgi:hypothetical protein